MIEYKVVTGRWESEIMDRVNAWLKQGWELQGGITLAISTSTLFAQAMIKQTGTPTE